MKLCYFVYIWLITLKLNQCEKNGRNIDTQFRLPNKVIPTDYLLKIHSSLEDNNFEQISSVTIVIRCIHPTNIITLHSRKLKITNVKFVNIRRSTTSIEQKYELEPEYDFLHIHLKEHLVMNSVYKLKIEFNGEIENGMSGYYRSSYKDEKGQRRWLSTTHFEPTHARTAFPCFDEPALRARFVVKLAHPKHLIALSNMPLHFTRKGEQGWVWDTFKESLNMSTYLVAYTINDFGFRETLKTNSYGNTTVKIWARKNSLKQVEFALDISPRILSFFEEYFDIAYPLPKSDMLAVPDFSAGAMENWGLITFRESQLLYVPGSATKDDKYEMANTIAHEIAHYWFGDLVTIKWWSHLWLKEGFATYLARIAVRHVLHEMSIYYTRIMIYSMQRVYAVDAFITSRPVSIPIDDPNRINEIYDAITYSKGSIIIRMMELFLGNDILKEGLRHYLKKYKYDSTVPDDLWTSLTTAAHEYKYLPEKVSVNQIMDTWTTQAGYPLVTVVRDYPTDTVTITQNRFLEDVGKHDNSCYWVPLTYTTKKKNDFNSTKPRMWLPCPKQSINFKLDKSESESWILFNIEASALYRVNYDQTNWKMLIDQLERDYTEIGTTNRVLLIDDVMKLAMTGHVDFKIAFDLIRYIKHDKDEITWSIVLRHLFKICNYLDHTPYYGLIKNYISKLVTPIFDAFGGLNYLKKFSEFQMQIIRAACTTESQNCRREATAMFTKWKYSGGKYTIPGQLRALVYCQGMKSGNEVEWNYLWHEYLKSNVATEKDMILDALGCTRKQWLLVRYLKWMIKKDSGIRHQDASKVLSSVIGNRAGYYIARLFFYEHVQEIYEIQSPNGSEMRYYVKIIASSLRTEREFNAFTMFLKDNKKYFKMAYITRRLMLEKIDILKYWYQNFYPKIVHILELEKQSCEQF